MRWVAVLLLVTVLLALAAVVAFTQRGCEAAGWKWGSVAGACTTPACALFGDCGHWASNFARCGNVQPGTRWSRVRFELGEPLSVDGGVALFEYSKQGGVITVTLDAGTVADVGCGPRPSRLPARERRGRGRGMRTPLRRRNA